MNRTINEEKFLLKMSHCRKMNFEGEPNDLLPVTNHSSFFPLQVKCVSLRNARCLHSFTLLAIS